MLVIYKLMKPIIDIISLVKVIINVLVGQYNLFESIISNQGSLFILKFLFSLSYFLGIQYKLSTIFLLETNGHIESENSTMEPYLYVFVNQKQNSLINLTSIARFPYNKANNISNNHISFELNRNYYLCIFFEDEIDSYLRSYLTNKPAMELEEWMSIFWQNLLYT